MLIGAYIMLANAIICFRVNENLNPYSLGELKACTIRQTLVSLVRDLAKLKKLCSLLYIVEIEKKKKKDLSSICLMR